MSSLHRSMKRKTYKVESPLHMSPTNNRKRTRGRNVQVLPNGRQIRHRPGHRPD
jgi:hypothetical protein